MMHTSLFKKKWLSLALITVLNIACTSDHGQAVPIPDRPNIVLIVADDMGFSDLGCFGSEIPTPNIDELARNGQILSNFYTAATCSPTRAMLLSGTDNHVAGLGNMAENVVNYPEQVNQPGYEGYLNDRVVSVAQLLKDAGYHTYIAGKWHLGMTAEAAPTAKGFERSFTLLNAYSNHYYPNERYDAFWSDGQYVRYPAGRYSTNVYTDRLLSFMENDKGDGKPFFLYAAYTSPHWPLQAPEEHIEKFRGKYDSGYDILREKRLQGLKEKGIIDKDISLPPLPPVKGYLYYASEETLPPWSELSDTDRELLSRSMEIYAGMMDNLDMNVGRIINFLKETGQYDNTLFVFMSDNGASCSEQFAVPRGTDPMDYLGTYNSFVAYGSGWAHATSALYRLYKGYSTEGGIHTPCIVKMPQQAEGQGVLPAFTSVMDLAPTFLDLSGTVYPSRYNGNQIKPLQGSSILPYLRNEQEYIHDENYVMGWELFGRAAVRKGPWKITYVEKPFGQSRFALYNLEADPSELKDVSADFPELYDEMMNHWQQYVEENGVVFLGK